MEERIRLERQHMQKKYSDFMSRKFGLKPPHEHVELGNADDFYTINGFDSVPSVVDLQGVSSFRTSSLGTEASILESEIDELGMHDYFPQSAKNFIGFKYPVFEQVNAKERKLLPQVKSEAHKTELAGYYHELMYESNQAGDDEYQIKDRERVTTYRTLDSTVREAAMFDSRKLWYSVAENRMEGQLFGINYEELTSTQRVEKDISPPLEPDFDFINGGNVMQFPGLHTVQVLPLVVSSVAHPSEVTSEKFVRDELVKYQKQIQAAPEEKRPRIPKEKPYLEGYDKKMVCGREYANYSLPSVLDGFRKNSPLEAYESSCNFAPSLCHAIVALIACESCHVRLREEDIFLCTCDRELITTNRQALPIRDILRVIRDVYPRLIDRYIKPPLKCFETIMTALLMMVSPNDEEISKLQILEDQVQFSSFESLFDERAGMPEVVHFTEPYPAEPAFLPPVHPEISGKSAIETAVETRNFEGDKTEIFKRCNENFFKREPEQKPQTSLLEQSTRHAEDILQHIGKVPHFPVSEVVNNTKLCRIEHSAENIEEFLEENAHIYVGQQTFGIMYQHDGAEHYENVSISSKELLKIDERLLYASPDDKEKLHEMFETKEPREVNSDSEDDVLADEIPFEDTPKCAVLGLSSPLLGEFILIPTNRPEYSYFGVDSDYLSRIAAVFNYQCEIDKYEIVTARHRFENGEFDKIAENEYTQRRIESLQKSKERVANSLQVVGEMYTDLQKYHFRAEERLRYFLLPHTTFPYVVLGLKSLSLKEKTAEIKQQSFKYIEYEKCVPEHLSKIAAVEDAICRLNGRFGTREDIMERCCDSNFYSWRDPRLEAKVSCALDRLRLHFVDPDKKMRLAMFDQKNKIWMLASARLEVILGDYEEEEWPSDLYDMYERGNRGIRPLGR